MSADVDLLAWVLPAADRPEMAEVRREARFEGADAATGLRTLETDGETLVVWSPRARPPEGVGRLTLWWAPDLGVSGAAEVVEASPDEAPGGGPRWRARLRPLDRAGDLAASLRRAIDQASVARVVSDEPLPAAAAAAQLAALCSRAAAGDVPDGPLDPAAAWDRIQALPDGVRAALASWSPVDGTTHRPCADDAVLLAALWALVEEGRERVRREHPDAPGDEVESLLLTAQDLFSDAAARRAIATGDSGAEKAAFAAARTLFLESALALRAAWSARAPERAAQVFPALRDAASYARADEAGPTRYAAGAFVKPDPRAWRARVWAAAAGRPGLARRVLGSLGATAALGALGAALLYGETLDGRLHPASAPIPPEELAAVSSVLSRAERSDGGRGPLVIATAGPAWTSMTTERRLREARRIGAALGRTGVSSAYVYDEAGKLLVTFGGNGPRLVR
ncbi:hypothetical protein L6R50_20425 [Myxococcota bacterium]|nr:hypothetical protein [Myxococcota bacterium]